MKKIFFIVVSVVINLGIIVAQNSNLEIISNYYNSLDKITLIDSSLATYNRDFIGCSSSPRNSVFTKKDVSIFFSDSIIVSIELKTKNIEKYNYKEDIYDFLEIRTDFTSIFYYREVTEKIYVLNSIYGFKIFDGSFGKDYKRDNFRKAWQHINSVNADAIMIDNWIFNDSTENVNYMYLKNNKIYVYRSQTKKIYELNDYLHKFIKEKKFKECAIPYENDFILVGSGI